MPALVAGIHVLTTSPQDKVVDGRKKSGQDDQSLRAFSNCSRQRFASLINPLVKSRDRMSCNCVVRARALTLLESAPLAELSPS